MNLWRFSPLIVVVILGCQIGTTLNSASIRERIQISAQLFSGWKTISYRSNSQSLQVIVCKASGIRDNSSLYKTNCYIERGRTSWEEVARRPYNWYFHINWSQLYFYNYMMHVQLVTLGVMKTLRKIQQRYWDKERTWKNGVGSVKCVPPGNLLPLTQKHQCRLTQVQTLWTELQLTFWAHCRSLPKETATS